MRKRGKGNTADRREIGIIDADHREVLRHLYPVRQQDIDHLHRHLIIIADNRRTTGKPVQQIILQPVNVLLHGSITPDYGKTLKRNVVSHDRIDIPLITERSLTVVGLEYSGYFPVAIPDQKFGRVIRDLPVVNSDTGYLQIGIKGIEEQNMENSDSEARSA